MSETEIVRAYWAIPLAQRAKLMEELKIKGDTEVNARISLYLNTMCMLIGGHIDLNSKERKHVDAKKVLAYHLHKKGYNIMEIGKIIGKNRATIYYYLDELRFALERGFSYSTTQMYYDYLKLLEEHDIH